MKPINFDNCIFCKIIKSEISCYKVNEDKDFLAFLDIHPHAKGHTVIIPKKHAETIFDLSETDTKKLILFVKIVMKKINDLLHPSGFNVGWNHSPAGGQVIPHLHIHIFPRYENDNGGSFHSIIKNPCNLCVEEVAKLFV